MPTQRPFFSNFLAAFRAHSAIQQGKTASTQGTGTHTTHTHTASHSTSTAGPSNPRTIASTAKTGATTTALTSLHSPRTHSTSPLSRSPGESSSPISTRDIGERDILGGQRMLRDRDNGRRRGSDSSSEGFRDVLGKEKWYVGGRTAAGEERYFKLGVVRRQRSEGRLSLDRLSL